MQLSLHGTTRPDSRLSGATAGGRHLIGAFSTHFLRRPQARSCGQARVSATLDGVPLAALDRAVYRSAGLPPMRYLRTLDALHLEAAIRLGVDAVLTYDQRLARGRVCDPQAVARLGRKR